MSTKKVAVVLTVTYRAVVDVEDGISINDIEGESAGDELQNLVHGDEHCSDSSMQFFDAAELDLDFHSACATLKKDGDRIELAAL